MCVLWPVADPHDLASSDLTELSCGRGSLDSHEQRLGLPARGARVKGGATASDSRHFQLHKRACPSHHLHQQQLHSSELGTHPRPPSWWSSWPRWWTWGCSREILKVIHPGGWIHSFHQVEGAVKHSGVNNSHVLTYLQGVPTATPQCSERATSSDDINQFLHRLPKEG